MKHGVWIVVSLVLVAVGVLLSRPNSATAEVVVGRVVPPGSRVSMDQIDHRVWDELLARYVDNRGRVDYVGWKRNASDMRRLDDYLATLSTAEPAAPADRRSKQAFWINAYNAVTVRGILREYPTSSIRNHTAKLMGYNIWDDLLLVVGDNKYSLNQMEHEILRKMGDPRIHFAIVCASHSCPKLLNRAYVASAVDQQLTANAQDFFSNPENFRFDPATGTFYLSSILKWFASDFGATQAERLKTIAQWLPTEAAQRAALQGRVKVRYLDYDWSLNEQPSR